MNSCRSVTTRASFCARTSIAVLAFISCMCVLADTCYGITMYVDANAIGNNNGESWVHAFVDLQDALDLARALGSPATEIWVAQGTYRPDRGSGDRDATFALVDGVGLYGGFASGDTFADRDPAAKPTVLSGDLLSNDDPGGPSGGYGIDCCGANVGRLGCEEATCEAKVCAVDSTCCTSGWAAYCRFLAQVMCYDCIDNITRYDNSAHVVTAESTTEGTILDGFAITAGYAADTGAYGRTGGGILVSCGNVTLQNCEVTGNTAAEQGGGVHVIASDNVSIANTTFDANRAYGYTSSHGGGGLAAFMSNLTVDECVFANNSTPIWSSGAGAGGGILIQRSDILVRDSDFSNNDAYYGGGGASYGDFGGLARFIDCLFLHNTCGFGLGNADGGAIQGAALIERCRFLDNTSDWRGGAAAAASIIDSEFIGNTASNDGGAVYGTLRIDRCLFEGNSSSSGSGGGVSNTREMTNSILRNNSAFDAGGGFSLDTFSSSSTTEISNCTFYNNSAGNAGGGLHAKCSGSANPAIRVTNSILWANTDSSGSVEDAQLTNLCPSWVLRYNDIEGLTGALGGVGNIGLDPLFEDAPGGDLHLQPGSPCIDAGDSTFGSCPALDFERDPRRLDDPATPDTGTLFPPLADIGADEFVPGDCNDNGVPDADDIASMTSTDLNVNGIPDECERDVSDCNSDGIADVCDPDCNEDGISDVCEPPATPVITIQPFSLAVCAGSNARFIIEADGGPGLRYDWVKNGESIGSGVDGIFVVFGVEASDEGKYRIIARDACGQVLSNPLTLTALGPSLPPAPTSTARRGSRFLPVVPSFGGRPAAIRVTLQDAPGFAGWIGTELWVGPPKPYPDEDSTDPGRTFLGAALQCEPHYRDWGTVGLVQVFGGEIMPDALYNVQMVTGDCSGVPEAPPVVSAALTVRTGKWGDAALLFDGDEPGVSQPDFNDIASIVKKFTGDPTAPSKSFAQQQPNTVLPDRPVNFKDIAASVSAFTNVAYADAIGITGPCTCPPSVTCDATACATDIECSGGYCIDGFCRDACGRCTP